MTTGQKDTTPEREDEEAARTGFPELASALGAVPRWEMLALLATAGPMSLKELARQTGQKRPTASGHTRVLREAGLVVIGKGRLYSIAPAFQPAPGSSDLRLGPCTLHFRAAAGGE